MSLTRVLIANRGEIAVRIATSVQAAGGTAIAVYSDADRDAPHVKLCDQAVCLGGSSAQESYLNINKILHAAKITNAQAIHPGYGFLSENAAFAQACIDTGLVFIGPSPEAIELMGNKAAAKAAVSAAGVPCIPGYQGKDQSDQRMLAEADRIGYPVMVKAASGGGGRGMRVVTGSAGVVQALHSARAEAKSAFGDDELILEKAISAGRHIEIQIAADAHGNVVYLGERDCSLQRRHQKVVEEAPSPFVDEILRRQIGIAAVNAARTCSYLGVGTVEFLVSEDRSFCFLEMNTRLQVEHPVTELITGVDLVDWQLRIANGEALPLPQVHIELTGHAIETRLYAEDPANGFMPQIGRILRWTPPQGEGVRVDSGIETGSQVSPYYDSMIAKIITYGDDREQARLRMVRALAQTTLLGVTTNRAFLSQLLQDEVFIAGAATTSYIDDDLLEQTRLLSQASAVDQALAVVVLMHCLDPQPEHLRNWSNVAPIKRYKTVLLDDAAVELTYSARHDDYTVNVASETVSLSVLSDDGERLTVLCGGVSENVDYAFDGVRAYIKTASRQLCIEDHSYVPALSANAASSGEIVATTEGQLVQIAVNVGDRVEKGQLLAVVEAMKMEHRHLADGAGVVTQIGFSKGTQVKKGQLLVSLNLDEGEAA